MFFINDGHRLVEKDRSHYHIVFEEELPSRGAVALFGIGTVLVFVLGLKTGFRSTLMAATPFVLFALYGSIKSTVTADRIQHRLVVERRILLWRVRRVYPAQDIDRIYVEDTRKGDGLAVLLRSGKKKRLTLSAMSQRVRLSEVAGALNYLLHV